MLTMAFTSPVVTSSMALPYGGIDFLQLVWGFFRRCPACLRRGGYHVTTVSPGKVYNIQVFIHHLLTVGKPFRPFQQGVEGFNATFFAPWLYRHRDGPGFGLPKNRTAFTLVVYICSLETRLCTCSS